eukprot:221132_1
MTVLDFTNICKIFRNSKTITFIMSDNYIVSYSQWISLLKDLKEISGLDISIPINFEWSKQVLYSIYDLNKSRINEYEHELNQINWTKRFLNRSISLNCKYTFPVIHCHRNTPKSIISNSHNATMHDLDLIKNKNHYISDPSDTYYSYHMYLVEAFIRKHLPNKICMTSQDIKHYILRVYVNKIDNHRHSDSIEYFIKTTTACKIKWSKIPIQTRINDKHRLELSIIPEQFNKQIDKFILENAINTFPIVVFKHNVSKLKKLTVFVSNLDSQNEDMILLHIPNQAPNNRNSYMERLLIVKVEGIFNIGILYKKKSRHVVVKKIFLNVMDILKQYVLVWNHEFNFLNNFNGIDQLYIGNLDLHLNQKKDLQQRLKLIQKQIDDVNSQIKIRMTNNKFLKSEHKKQSGDNQKGNIGHKYYCSNMSSFANNIAAKDNIQISKKLTRDIIPVRIKEIIPNVFDYMSKMTCTLRQDTYIGNYRILNYGFHDKITDEVLYCVATRKKPNKYYNFHWIMKNKLYTKKDICECNKLCNYDIPQSPTESYSHQIMKETKQIENILRNDFFSTIDWTNTPIQHKRNNKRRLTMKITQIEFIKEITQYISKNGVFIVPILSFDSNYRHIAYVQIVRIVGRVDIGISYRFNQQNDIAVEVIYLDKTSINVSHVLALQHDCHCLDDFTECIDRLVIGNVAAERNQVKILSRKLRKAKQILKDLQLQLKMKRKGHRKTRGFAK